MRGQQQLFAPGRCRGRRMAGGRCASADAESFPECQGLPAVSCELQLIRPSVALVMFGTNDLEDFTATQFRLDLARVARLVSSAGTIPVISTIPPRARQPFSQRVARFNAEIAALAEEPGAAALELLAADGCAGSSPRGSESTMASTRAFSVHPAPRLTFGPLGLRQGYALRNLGALRRP